MNLWNFFREEAIVIFISIHYVFWTMEYRNSYKEKKQCLATMIAWNDQIFENTEVILLLFEKINYGKKNNTIYQWFRNMYKTCAIQKHNLTDANQINEINVKRKKLFQFRQVIMDVMVFSSIYIRKDRKIHHVFCLSISIKITKNAIWNINQPTYMLHRNERQTYHMKQTSFSWYL